MRQIRCSEVIWLLHLFYDGCFFATGDCTFSISSSKESHLSFNAFKSFNYSMQMISSKMRREDAVIKLRNINFGHFRTPSTYIIKRSVSFFQLPNQPANPTNPHLHPWTNFSHTHAIMLYMRKYLFELMHKHTRKLTKNQIEINKYKKIRFTRSFTAVSFCLLKPTSIRKVQNNAIKS